MITELFKNSECYNGNYHSYWPDNHKVRSYARFKSDFTMKKSAVFYKGYKIYDDIGNLDCLNINVECYNFLCKQGLLNDEKINLHLDGEITPQHYFHKVCAAKLVFKINGKLMCDIFHAGRNYDNNHRWKIWEFAKIHPRVFIRRRNFADCGTEQLRVVIQNASACLSSFYNNLVFLRTLGYTHYGVDFIKTHNILIYNNYCYIQVNDEHRDYAKIKDIKYSDLQNYNKEGNVICDLIYKNNTRTKSARKL